MDGIIFLLLFIAAVNAISFVTFCFIITEIKNDIKSIKGILNYRI